ncbi:hypothetical protein E2C01_080964 [Portunus trituberculatus]|uniref:Uncharacterized protein n=1 Tax=Portunus trituberculatus TaxID=210409 RepID=A0A5B7IZS3_PORTR|nr:hypothetical protein [Portunus trituberculatus]
MAASPSNTVVRQLPFCLCCRFAVECDARILLLK